MIHDLVETTWDRFLKLKEEYHDKVLLYDIVLSSEQILEIQTMLIKHVNGSYNPLWDTLRKKWSYEGILFLSCCVFAKYERKENEKFWYGWKKWIGQEINNPNSHLNMYAELKKFASSQQLYLYSSPKKTMYVSSFNTHAFMSAAHCVGIFHFLKLVAIGNMYRMDIAEQKELLVYTINAIGAGVNEDSSTNDDDSDDSEHTKKYYGLHRGFRRASAFNPSAVCNALEVPFRMVLNTILSAGKYDFLSDFQESLEPFIVIAYKRFLQDLSDETADLQKIVIGSTGRRKRCNKPEYRYDFDSNQLVLSIPEMRLDPESEDMMISVVLHGQNVCIESSLDIRYYRSILIGTAEKNIPVTKFFPGLICDIKENNTIIRSFDMGDKYHIFDDNGDVLSLPCRNAQDAFVLVQYGIEFISSDNSVFFEDESMGYAMYQVHINEETCFIIGNVMISPFFIDIPIFRIVNEHLDTGSYLLDEQVQKIRIYHELPKFQIRSTSREDLILNFPVRINGKSFEYQIESEILLMDGSGETCFTVTFDEQVNEKYHNKVIDIRFALGYSYSLKCIVLRGLKYAFTHSYYRNDSDVRVSELIFEQSDQIYSRNYTFPMKDKNTRFKIKLNDTEYRLCLVPPSLDMRLSDGTPIVPEVWHSVISSKTLFVSDSFKNICLELEFETGEKSKIHGNRNDSLISFPLSCLHRDNTLSGRVEVSISFYSSGAEIKEKFCTVYSVFTSLKPVRLNYRDSATAIRNLINEKGQYLLIECIADPGISYQVNVTNKQQSASVTVDIPNDQDKIKCMKICDNMFVDGKYDLTIISKRFSMGMSGSDEKVEYEIKDLIVCSGEIVKIKQVEQRDLKDENKSEQIINDNMVLKCVKTESGNLIRNFYLKIFDESIDGAGYLADGYFVAPDNRRQFHTLFNPYFISNLSQKGNDVFFEITDKEGKYPSVDVYGRVNCLTASTMSIAKKIHGNIHAEGDYIKYEL